jgi:hypothetical protein
MITIDLSYDTVLKTLREVVAEAGSNFVYERPAVAGGCVYQYRGEPSCGVGRVFAKLGVPIETLKSFDHEIGGASASKALSMLRMPGYSAADLKVKRLLKTFQSYQDTGASWGASLALAVDAAENLE